MLRRVAVPSSDFIRNVGRWQNEALRHPVFITHHGRDRLVLASAEEFQGHGQSEKPSGAASEAELAELRANLEGVLESIEEAYLIVDASLCVQAANSVATAFFRLSREELRGAPLQRVFPELPALILIDRLQRLIRTGRAETFESEAFDGRHLLVRMFPVQGGAAVLFNNVTEQRRLAQQREDAVAMERAVSAHSQLSIMRLDFAARILSADESFCGWTGFKNEEIVGHRLVELIAGPTRREATAAIESVLRDKISTTFRANVLGRRGDEVVCDFGVAPVLCDFVPRGAILTMLRHDRR